MDAGIRLLADRGFNLVLDAFKFLSIYIDYMIDIRVMIVDDVEQVRQDLRTLLTLIDNLNVVGEARNGNEAIQRAKVLLPDVILMDLEMPVLNGFEATRRIKNVCPSCRVIALTIHDHESARLKAAQSGMDGFIVKGAPLETLVRVISRHQE